MLNAENSMKMPFSNFVKCHRCELGSIVAMTCLSFRRYYLRYKKKRIHPYERMTFISCQLSVYCVIRTYSIVCVPYLLALKQIIRPIFAIKP